MYFLNRLTGRQSLPIFGLDNQSDNKQNIEIELIDFALLNNLNEHSSLSRRVTFLSQQPAGDSVELVNGPLTRLTLCDPEESSEIYTKLNLYEKCSEQWIRNVLQKKEGPISEEEFKNIFINSFQSWFGYRETFRSCIIEINAQFAKRDIVLDESTSHLRLYLTSGKQKAHTGHYTMDNSIFLITNAGGFYKLFLFGLALYIPIASLKKTLRLQIMKHITHEFYHVWSRNNPKEQEYLYNQLGFFKCEVEVLHEYAQRLFFNPDLAYHVRFNYQNKWVMPISLIDTKKCTYDGNIKRIPGEVPLPDYLQVEWLEVEEIDGTWCIKMDDNQQVLCLKDKPQLSNIFGVDYTVHPEEILAEIFVHWIWPEIISNPAQDERLKAYFPFLSQCFCKQEIDV